MNIHKMIAELQVEKERLDEAILALERLSAGKARRRAKSSRAAARDTVEPEAHERQNRAREHASSKS